MKSRYPHLASQPEVVDDITVELSRNKSAAELTLLASRLFAANRERLRSYLRTENPQWSEEQLHRELCGRIHGTK